MIALLVGLAAAHAVDMSVVAKNREAIIARAQSVEKEGRVPGVIENLIAGPVETSMRRMEERRLWQGQARR